ncbi:hypothetical protein Pcar_0371 [Syntrophotalea carbinolica DSM 2380]|uniref:DUF2752 domain-containing protein n=1 Tax=Syntrophotalea carbinolica (strain DSM 2380 / NBRC 103641 / GraBd1) TaxID=338963 RepID=Q3A7L3_SYNC1|nr:DUF2752 domain-containing protein [Syntrophotalea carbinolica]ABA87631.2 hypothetical protein Pcar_0371 [Syntrophotalea carbinolica DSM 2380]
MLPERFAVRFRDWGCWRRFLLVVGAVVATGVLLCFSPVENRWFPPCPFRSLTGWYCPGCGSTRALHHLLHGRIGAAFGYNALMVVSVPFLLVRGVAGLIPGRALRGFDEKALKPAAIIGICVLVVVYGVLRNLPAYPFSFLAPHG